MSDDRFPANPFLTPDGVARIAALARLRPAPDELARLAPQMEKIVRHVERILEIPESLLAPITELAATPLRDDLAVPADGYAELSANAKDMSHRHVAVPRVVG